MVVAAAAKLCKADGKVTKREIAETEELLNLLELTGELRKPAIELFASAKDGLLTYAETIIAFKDFCCEDADSALIVTLCMFRIAHADGDLSEIGRECLDDTCRILGMSYDECLKLHLDYQRSRISETEAYTILGCDPNASTEVIKDRYRLLVKEFHPDTIASKQLPGAFNQFAEEKFKTIQAAYESIVNARGRQTASQAEAN
jgi:DnaJ like chaperone protein